MGPTMTVIFTGLMLYPNYSKESYLGRRSTAEHHNQYNGDTNEKYVYGPQPRILVRVVCEASDEGLLQRNGTNTGVKNYQTKSTKLRGFLCNYCTQPAT